MRTPNKSVNTVNIPATTPTCSEIFHHRVITPQITSGVLPIQWTVAKVNSSAFRICAASNSIGGR